MKLIPGAVTPLGILNDAEHRVQVFMDVEFVGNKIGVHQMIIQQPFGCRLMI